MVVFSKNLIVATALSSSVRYGQAYDSQVQMYQKKEKVQDPEVPRFQWTCPKQGRHVSYLGDLESSDPVWEEGSCDARAFGQEGQASTCGGTLLPFDREFNELWQKYNNTLTHKALKQVLMWKAKKTGIFKFHSSQRLWLFNFWTSNRLFMNQQSRIIQFSNRVFHIVQTEVRQCPSLSPALGGPGAEALS